MDSKKGDVEGRIPGSLIVAILLLGAFPTIMDAAGAMPLQSTRSGFFLHTILEWSCVSVSLFTAALGVLYLRTRSDFLVYTVTVAAAASAIWGSVHMAAGVGLLEAAAGTESFLPWSSAAGRLLRALILAGGAAYLVFSGGKRPPWRWTSLAAIAAAVGGAAFLFIAVSLRVPLPQTHFDGGFVTRPWNLPALAIFCLNALVLYPLLVRRQPSLLAKLLALGSVTELIATLEMAFIAAVPYDVPFFTAHSLELVAAILPLSGICLHLVSAYRREIQVASSMEKLVSDLKSTQDELRSKEVWLNQLTTNSQEVFWISAADGSAMHYVSPAYDEVFGLSSEELYEKPTHYFSVLHPEDRHLMVELIEGFVDTEFELDYRIIRHGEEVRWLRTRGFPIRDEHGEVYRLAGVTEDVTERKLAEEELRKSEARTRALLRAMPDLMFRMTRSGTVVDYHAQPATPLFKPPSVFLGAPIQNVLGEELGDQFTSRIEEALALGTVTSLEYRLDCGGRIGEFEARFSPASDTEVLVVVREVTEQNRLQREILDISNREQERIGHDLHDGISQQLTGIAMLCKVLQRQLSARSLPEADRALQIEELVEDALAQTKSLARGLAPVEIDAGGLPTALEDLAHGIERVHKVRCRCQCDRNIAVGSRAEAVHLYRIAQEAVSNALRHGSPTRIAIELTSSNGRMRLSVQDDGRGIGEARKTKGMGLHIMRYRARMIDARLEIRPGPERGTIVTCEWAGAAEPAPRQVRWS